MNRTVGIAQMGTSNDKADLLVTYSLGSCVGLTAYDAEACVGGLIHCMLPVSKVDPGKAEANPCMFVDTGVPAFLEALFGMGAQKERMVVKAAGASSMLDEKGLFKIGQRNHTALQEILRRSGIVVVAEDMGGTATRTMLLYMGTGLTTVKSVREVVL